MRRIFTLVSRPNKNIALTYQNATPISAGKEAALNIFLHSSNRKSVIYLTIYEEKTKKTFSYEARKTRTSTKGEYNVDVIRKIKKITKRKSTGGVKRSEVATARQDFLNHYHILLLYRNYLNSDKDKQEKLTEIINEATCIYNKINEQITIRSSNPTSSRFPVPRGPDNVPDHIEQDESSQLSIQHYMKLMSEIKIDKIDNLIGKLNDTSNKELKDVLNKYKKIINQVKNASGPSEDGSIHAFIPQKRQKHLAIELSNGSQKEPKGSITDT